MPATPTPDAGDGIPEPVRDLLAEFGADSRRIRAVLCRLAEPGPGWTLGDLVAATGSSRRTVEATVRAAGDDLDTDVPGGRLRLAGAHAQRYRRVLGCPKVAAAELTDPVGHLLPAYSEAAAEITRLVAEAPRGRRALDHVAATPATALRRALYLDTRFWLAGSRLLCVGDHDLTSLATALVNPGVEVLVVDVDERICAYIDEAARRLGLAVRCRYADLRLGLPPSAEGYADIVFTDPPYTAEGVALFCARGLEGLRDRANGRLLVAYGHGEGLPGLGAKVQAAMSGLHLAYEAILPGFNAYTGAEAIGGVSDLYVCRPTSRTWSAALPRGAAARVYSQGPNAVEAGRGAFDAAAAAEVLARYEPALLVGEWPDPVAAGHQRAGLATWLGGASRSGPAGAVAVNLADGYAESLPRVLLAATAPRVAVVVDNDAELVRSAAGQEELAELVAPTYRLRYLRSTPAPRLAVVAAERVDPRGDAELVLRWIQDRPHGKVANTWREGLVALSRRRGGPVLTKNAARAVVAGFATAESCTLLELPRHRLHALAADVAASVAGLDALAT